MTGAMGGTIVRRFMIGGMLVAAWTAAVSAADYETSLREAHVLLNARLKPALAAPAYDAALALATNEAQRLAVRIGLGISRVRWSWESGNRFDREQGLALVADALSHDAVTPAQRAQCLELIAEDHARALRSDAARAAHEQIARLADAPAYSRARAWLGVAQAEYDLERFPASRAACERALAAAREAGALTAAQQAEVRRAAQRALAKAWSAEGRFDDAIALYRAMAESEEADKPVRVDARLALANVQYEAGLFPEACAGYLAVWDALSGIEPRRVARRLDTIYRMQVQKADALFEAGDPAAARLEYGRVLGMDQVRPHHQAAARLGMGHAWLAEKKYTEAAAEYEAVLAMKGALWPDRGRAQRGLAQIAELQGRVADARKAYERLLAMKNVAPADREAALAALKTP